MKNFNLINRSFLLLFIGIVFSSNAQEINIPSDSIFFNGVVPNRNPIHVSKPVTASKIITAINKASRRARGGVVKIPSGTHRITDPIILKSNVHIEITGGTTFIPTRTFGGMFSIGTSDRSNQRLIRNIRIYSSSDTKYTIDYSKFKGGDKIAGFDLGYVTNFKIEDAEIKDNQTFLSGFSITPPPGGSFNKKTKNGIIQNCTILNSDYGYGLVQVQVGENILFKNLSGSGGVTVRFESGFSLLTNAGRTTGTSTKLYAYKTSCKNGNAAVMISPHTKVQGTAVIKDVTAENCSFGIRIDKGFAERGKAAGTYRSVIVGGKIKISRNQDDSLNLAQIKQKHHVYYPVEFRRKNPFNSFPLTGGTDPISRKAPGIAPIHVDAQLSANNIGPKRDGHYQVTYRRNGNGNSQTFNGFKPCTPSVVYENDKRRVCLNNRELLFSFTNKENNTHKINVYPIPTSGNSNIIIENLPSNSQVKIYDMQNNLLISKTFISNNSPIYLDVSSLRSGIYIAKINSGSANFLKTLVVN